MSELAIKGGSPVRKQPISYWPVFDKAEEKYLLDVLHSREWGKTSGRMNERFEKEFSKFQQSKYTVTVCNGTVALRIALYAAGVGPGDEVIIPSYTFVATATAVIESNAIPVFADMEEDTFNISPESIEQHITEKTKAIIPVHFAGAPANMDRVMEIAKKYNLAVIEDAAQAQGSSWDGRRIGSFGDAGTFSFQLSKNMTAGEGGAIVTDKDNIEEKVRSFHNCGRKVGSAWYYHYDIGGNYRLSEFQAAVLMAQLEREEDNLRLRRKNAAALTNLLNNIEGIEPAVYPAKAESSFYLYAARYNKKAFNGLSKKKFVEAMNAEGIATLEGYPFPLYKQPLFIEKNFWPKDCPCGCPMYNKQVSYTGIKHPVSEKLCEIGFWFPNLVLHGNEEDTADIAAAIKKIQKFSTELAGE